MALTLTGPIQILNQLLGNKEQQNYSFVPSNKLKENISLNDTITATVEKDLGQGKYLIQVRGENVVAESKTPFKLNDIIHGRVIGLSDKVELQRIYANKAGADKQSASKNNLEQLYAYGKSGNRAAMILQNYRVNLSAEEQVSLISNLKTLDAVDTIALTAVVLNKMGVQVTSDTLNTLYPVLSDKLKQKFNLQEIMAEVGFEKASSEPATEATIKDLADFIYSVVDITHNDQNFAPLIDVVNQGQSVSEQGVELDMEFSGDENSNNDKYFDPTRILLNTQSDGAVSHRVCTVPFMLNNQLVEVDVALFSQKHNVNFNTHNHKRIVLSLDLDTIGKIEIEVRLAGKHARINLNTENNIITNELVKYMPNLKADFENKNLNIDELSYGVKEKSSIGAVMGSVVEHYITQDSLSRLY